MKLDDIPQDIEPQVGDILEIEQGDVCFEVRIIGITADGYLCEQDNVQGAILLEGTGLDEADATDIEDFLRSGGKIQQLPYRNARKEKSAHYRLASRHIGGAGHEQTKGKLAGLRGRAAAVNVSGTGKAVVGEEDIEESGLQYYTGVKKHGEKYMKLAAKAGREGASQEELGRLRDRYSKAEKTSEGRFDEPLTGWHIVYRNSGNPVHATPSFETKEQAQKYLMTKMFANHQDFKVVHTAGVGVSEGTMKSLAIGLLNKRTPQEVANAAIGALNKKAPGTKMHNHPDFSQFKRDVHAYVSAADSGSEAVRRSSDDHVKSLYQKYFVDQDVSEGSDLPPKVIEMIKKIAQSSASPEHKKAAIDALVAKYSKKGVAEGTGFDQEAGIGLDGESFKFKIKDLVALANNYPVTPIDPRQFTQQIKGRNEDPTQSMARAEKADLQYPIIVVQRTNGKLWIADGTHRAHKAILNKIPKINAKIIPIKDMSSFSVKQGVAEGSDDIRKKISRFEELALQANKAGDDAKSKMYQQKIQSLKQKMSQGVAEGPEEHEYSLSMGNRQRPGSDRLDTDSRSRMDSLRAQEHDLKQRTIDILLKRHPNWERSDLELAPLRELIDMLRKPASEGMDEAKYQGREVPLGKKMAGDVAKSKVYVRKPNGKVVKVNFGDKNMTIKKSNPKRRKSFRARHNCDNPGPRWKARYWSCRSW